MSGDILSRRLWRLYIYKTGHQVERCLIITFQSNIFWNLCGLILFSQPMKNYLAVCLIK